MMKRLVIFDFDGTLIDSPKPEIGKPIWKEKTGEDFPYQGWWGRKESLYTQVFDIKPFPSVLAQLRKEKATPDTSVVILTSRMEKLRPQVENILLLNDISVDDILLKSGGESKGDVILKIENYNQDLEEIIVYDDYMEKDAGKIAEYTSIKDKLSPDVKYTLYYVDNGNISLLEGDGSVSFESTNKLMEIINEEINSFINEMSFHSLTYDNVINNEYVNKIKMSDEYERFIEYFKYEEGLEDLENEEIENHEYFEGWFHDELKMRFDDAMDKISSKIKPDNTIDIWRMMTVDDNWMSHLIQSGKHLGIYWSWEENAAEAHWGSGGKQSVLIQSLVNENYINWEDTIELNMNISLGDEEKEIRLFKNTPIKIIGVEINNEQIIDTPEGNQIKNKTFYA